MSPARRRQPVTAAQLDLDREAIRALRREIADRIERDIALLDAVDDDPDREPGRDLDCITRGELGTILAGFCLAQAKAQQLVSGHDNDPLVVAMANSLHVLGSFTSNAKTSRVFAQAARVLMATERSAC